MQQLDLTNTAGVAAVVGRTRRHVIPPPPFKPSEWAEQFCRIPASNALAGPVRFRNAPYQREPLDMVAAPECRQITLMWGAQTGKTQVQLMSMGYFIAHDAKNQIALQPTKTDMNTWLATKFNPMVESTPAIKTAMVPPRSRKGVNNQEIKQYTGGALMLAWSGSASTLRGRSAPKLYCDEVDGYEFTREGHPVNLVSERNKTFGDDRLLFVTSTPTLKGASYVETSFEHGDMRRWYVPCPHCREKQYLKWTNVQWLKDDDGGHQADTAKYQCESCAALWDDAERFSAIRQGEWIAEKPFDGHASFHIPSMCSLFLKLSDIVRDFLKKKQAKDLQSFINTALAETWEEEGDSVDPGSLLNRVEKYPAEAPKGVAYLSAGVDVQQDRVELEVVGWGAGEESWSVDYIIIPGDTAKMEVWEELAEALRGTYEHEAGVTIGISAVAVDRGFMTGMVDRFVDGFRGALCWGVQGRAGFNKRTVETKEARLKRMRKMRKQKAPRETVYVDDAKMLLYRRLVGIAESGPGYCHFGAHCDEEYFAQLTGERLIQIYRNGVAERKWKPVRPRVEALDCRNYAYAAMLLAEPDLTRKVVCEKPKSVPKPRMYATPKPRKRLIR